METGTESMRAGNQLVLPKTSTYQHIVSKFQILSAVYLEFKFEKYLFLSPGSGNTREVLGLVFFFVVVF